MASTVKDFEDFIEKSLKKKTFRIIVSRKLKSLKTDKEIKNFIKASEKIPNEDFRNRIIRRLNNIIKKRPRDDEQTQPDPTEPPKKTLVLEEDDESQVGPSEDRKSVV